MGSLEKYYTFNIQHEYKKNPSLSTADVQEVLNWSRKNVETHGELTEFQVIMFMHACNYDKEFTKQTLRQCFALQAKKCACYFSGRDPSHIYFQKQMDVIYINIVMDEDTGYSYIWSKLKVTDPAQYYPKVATKALFMAIELDQLEHGTRPGYRLMLDSDNFGVSHALRYSLTNTRNLMSYVQEGTSFVIEKINVFNVNVGTERVYMTMKPFMSSSLINKIVLKKVSKTKDFLKSLPQTVVPKDYGGLASSMEEAAEKLRRKMMDNRDYFLDEETFRNGFVNTQKEKPIEKLASKEHVPSFRNLSID